MLFNSLEFLFFFPLVTALYFIAPLRARWKILLSASIVFYMAFVPVYIFILAAIVLIGYWLGLVIESDARRKGIYLTLGTMLSLAILFVFKYFNFFNENTQRIAEALRWNYSMETLKWVLPIGISFYTFQNISYLIDVFRGRRQAEKHLGYYALYIMFYPQLVAGPIERAGNLLPQFRIEHKFEYRRVTNGLKLMAWGFFKKLVVADRSAMFVDAVYSDPQSFQGVSFMVATFFFAFQIYCDFSGYSDIAIGSAEVMGIRLMDNFNRPYSATSITEVWRRWHISLSSWIQDYLYTPLVIRFRDWGQAGTVCAVVVAFVLVGLWHGANWTFVIYGLMQGAIISLEYLSAPNRKKFLRKIPRIVSNFVTVTLTFIVWCLTLIVFRAQNLNDALYIYTHLLDGVVDFARFIYSSLHMLNKGAGILYPIFLGIPKSEFVIGVLAILFMELVHFLERHNKMRTMFEGRPLWLRWSIYYTIVFSLLTVGVYRTEKPFIYFQF